MAASTLAWNSSKFASKILRHLVASSVIKLVLNRHLPYGHFLLMNWVAAKGQFYCTCMHIQAHVYLPTCMDTYIHIFSCLTQTDKCSYLSASKHAYMHACRHTYNSLHLPTIITKSTILHFQNFCISGIPVVWNSWCVYVGKHVWVFMYVMNVCGQICMSLCVHVCIK